MWNRVGSWVIDRGGKGEENVRVERGERGNKLK